MSIKKVLLATKAELPKIKYPCILSPKLDGIRCVTPNRMPKTRTMRDIPNRHIQQCFELATSAAANLDGELVTFTDGKMDDFNTIQSKVMTHAGRPNFQLLVFDSIFKTYEPFHHRLKRAEEQVGRGCGQEDMLKMVPHIECFREEQLNEFERACVDLGYEGIMVRSPEGLYKEGRSTVNQGILLKVKRFDDVEATVRGSKPMYDVNKVLVPDMLGAFIVTCREFGVFDVGSGFTAAQRAEYWKFRDDIVRQKAIATIKYQPFGMKPGGKPRFPTFKGFRSPLDI